MHKTPSRSSKTAAFPFLENANLLPEITAGEAGEVDTQLQAEHINVLIRISCDVDDKLRRWDLLRKFDGLGDGVVPRFHWAPDLRIRIFTARSVEDLKPFDRTRGMKRGVRGRLP